jgi:hypothetical protein
MPHIFNKCISNYKTTDCTVVPKELQLTHGFNETDSPQLKNLAIIIIKAAIEKSERKICPKPQFILKFIPC